MTARTNRRSWKLPRIIVERWWLYLWTSWGSVLGLVVGLIDRSWLEGIVCLAVAAFIVLFGMDVWVRFCMLFHRMPQIYSEKNLRRAREVSVAHWIADEQLEFIDPNRKPWELYGVLVFGQGIGHGLLIGPLVGGFVPLCLGFSQAAWQGAALGSLFGPLFVCCAYAISVPVKFARRHRGPSIEGIQPLVRAAAEEARRLEPDAMSINHRHLLIALLRHPSVALNAVLSETNANLDRLADRIGQMSDQSMVGAQKDQISKKVPMGILDSAVERARKAALTSVDEGHVFLALADAWPKLMRETLSSVGLKLDRVVNELEARLRLPE